MKHNLYWPSHKQCIGCIYLIRLSKTHIVYLMCVQPMHSPHHGYNYSYVVAVAIMVRTV